MNIPVHEDRTTISFEPPTSKEGQYIALKAEMDLVIAFSACPQVSSPSSYFVGLRQKGVVADDSPVEEVKRKR